MTLKTKLDMLQIYCKEKKLCVNINNSKKFVFYANESKTSLMYKKYVLEEVDCFNYLRLTWHRKRNALCTTDHREASNQSKCIGCSFKKTQEYAS